MRNFEFDPLTDTTATIVAKVGLAFIDEAQRAVAGILLGGNADEVTDRANAIVASLRPYFLPGCDCPMDPHHRWNCALTPIWAQTIRDLDLNPWTVSELADLAATAAGSYFRRDPIHRTRMIEGREHTSWYEPTSGVIVETVVPATPPLRGMIESFIAFEATENPYNFSVIEPRWCTIHSEYHAPGCAL